MNGKFSIKNFLFGSWLMFPDMLNRAPFNNVIRFIIAQLYYYRWRQSKTYRHLFAVHTLTYIIVITDKKLSQCACVLMLTNVMAHLMIPNRSFHIICLPFLVLNYFAVAMFDKSPHDKHLSLSTHAKNCFVFHCDHPEPDVMRLLRWMVMWINKELQLYQYSV